MAKSRITRALNDGAVNLPEVGKILVMGPAADFDLSAIDPFRVCIQQGFFPDYHAWENRGIAVSVAPVRADAAIICLPRAKKAAFDRIANALDQVPVGAPVLIDGLKEQGIDAILKAVRVHFDVTQVFSKAHGKIFQIAAAPPPPDWRAQDQTIEQGFRTAAGVFSADRIDPGSAALAAVLPKVIKGRVADLGSGWGYLSTIALERERITKIDLVEAEHAAVEAARVNVTDPRANIIWGDATTFQPDDPYDAVICNPPFHEARRADPGLGRRFIQAAAGMLRPKGTLWLVANRHLPYETTLNEVFSEVAELPGPPAFKLFRAARPRRRR